jgi:hypothetical protein
MKPIINRYATPFITGLFLVSLISGVALYFGIGQAYFHQMHEILSLVLILPFVLHLWKNWRPMTGYFKHRPFYIAAVISFVAAMAYVVPQIGATQTGRSGPPQFALANKMMNAPVSAVAPVLGLSAEDMVTKLSAAGYTVASAEDSLATVATASGAETTALASAVLGFAN